MPLTEQEKPKRVLNADDEDEDVKSAAKEEEISLLDLAIVLVRGRYGILRVVLITTLVGVVVSFLLPTKYTATTSILPPQQTNSAGSALLSQLGSLGSMASFSEGGLGLKNPNDLQVALLKSRTVEDAMINRFHLVDLFHAKRMSDAENKLEHVVDIESSAKDPLIRISVTDRDPRRAADLANGYVNEFKELEATLAVTEASRRRLFFEEQMQQAKENLANAEEALKRTEQKTGLIQLDSQARAAIESAAQLRAQAAAKEVQIRALRTFATDNNPELQTAEQELVGLQAQLEQMGATGGGSAPTLLPKGQASLEYVRKLRDVKYFETIFELLARQWEAAKIDEARQGATVQVVDKAVIPDHHSSPKRTWIVLGSVFFGILLGVFRAFAAEGFRRLSSNPEERARLEVLRALLSSKPRKAAL
jgi:uncharacterized protein involved in exopolysaccharide biosynthesis